MRKNIGGLDRTIRLIIGIALLVFGYVNDSVYGAIGLIPIFTALISWCPLYLPLGINTTCKNDSCEN